jgi:hypothetical protein
MAIGDDVDSFLKEFKILANTFHEIFIHPRKKNINALLQLEITSKRRENVILGLSIENYYRGPTKNTYPDEPEYF